MSAPKTVGTACVIGAGVSGLTATKHLLENGMDVVCFEKSQHIGGLWRYNEEDREGYGSVMKNTILNTSKEFVTFSDFPMDPSLPNFMPNQLFYSYLLEYAEHFDLVKHIQFGTTVKSVSLPFASTFTATPLHYLLRVTEDFLLLQVIHASNYEETGEWNVTTENQGIVRTATFSHVMICIGHHVCPYKPTIDGAHLFNGTFSHSHDYKVHKLSRETCAH
ncbi:Flavin-binding monooxygenase-like protein [Ancylostoma caninum]|uniref:Flavin-containing monooxygenase n=1 Tax=Ancylostoma caninum TaxID=29170 RepID=A0A368FIP6_ANCCA|nr:Flavin-binding monooxygenase-like protein [Ancylostoma caninum]